MKSHKHSFLNWAFLFLLFGVSTAWAAAKPRVPVIFIPGYAASRPVDDEALKFVFHRGFPPDKLAISPSYSTLVKALEEAGYQEGKTFFGAAYDFRMSAAPNDGNFDGVLEDVTARSITSGNYSYAVNYLGYWLKQAVRANPRISEIDVVTHSTGGILARAYVQSPAYGASFRDHDGKMRKLPTIRYLILGAAPNEGTAHSWRPWNGDAQDVLTGFIPTTEIEGRFAALAFADVAAGGRVKGPDYIITRNSILQIDINGHLIPDATTFFRLYDPMRQSLMATYDFLQPPGGSSYINVNDDPSVRSDVLLDLNALSSPGNNPWLSLVGTRGRGGAIATYATGARQKTSFLDFLIPGLINNNPFVFTVTNVIQLTPPQGSYLPLIELLKPKPTLIPVSRSPFVRIGDTEVTQQLSGDGNGDFVSLIGTFAGDPNITIVQWGNGPPPADVPVEMIWTKITGYPVYHDVFFFNKDVAAYVVSVLTKR